MLNQCGLLFLDEDCKAAKINETQTQSFIGFLLNNKTGDISIKPTNQVLHFNNDFPHVIYIKNSKIICIIS